MDNANALIPRRTTAIVALLWLTARSAADATQPHSGDWATQGFYFDWNSPNTVLPTPITAQCETLNIHWNRAAGTGPDPIPPFFLRVHSSAVNSSVDSFQLVPAGSMASTQLTIPFPPGTLYVICMTDSVGVSGGCQDLYTVYPPTTNQTCSDFTPPDQVLGMRAISLATQSKVSRWGWPASCTDLELEPIDDGGGIKGTPPYTLTVVPAFRRPLNITFEQSVKWTITLAHGAPFFLSVSDANGVTWTDGPLHAGAGDTSCLSQPTSSQSGVSLPTTLGAAIGAFFLGAILALIIFWLVVRRHRTPRPYQFDKPQASLSNHRLPRREASRTTFTPLAGSENAEFAHTHSYSALANPPDSSTRKRPNTYGPLDSYDSVTLNLARQRTPDNHSSPPETSIPLRTTHRSSSSEHLSVASPTISTSANPLQLTSPISPPVPGAVPVHEVFVVHHDAGAPPPVTVYALPGSRVTELPPGYNFGSRSPESGTGYSQSQAHLTLVGGHPSPASPTSTFTHRDQKASYTPRSAPAPITTFQPLDPTSPKISTFDEQPGTATPTRLLPSTPQMQGSRSLGQTPSMPDLHASITSRTRGPRPMSPPK